jgi:TPR repeat protein
MPRQEARHDVQLEEGFMKLTKLVLAAALLLPLLAFAQGKNGARADASWPRMTDEIFQQAKRGDAGARALMVGLAFQQGVGRPQDHTEAVTWFRDAAELGRADGQLMLGRAYWTGEGVSQDYVQAVYWYRKAAEQGHGYAQCRLGVAYHYGEGVAQDHGQAASWFRKAAEKGIDEAQFLLGLMYQFARGVPRDFTQANNLFRKAAVQGYAGGQAMLGYNYEHGNGVPQDFVLAYAWLNLAASQGEENTRAGRDSVAEKLTPSELAEAQRLSSRWQSGKGIERESSR